MYADLVPSIFKDNTDEEVTPTLADDNTKSMEAGYMSLFERDGQQALDTYWQVRDEQDEFGSSPTADGIRTALHEEEKEVTKQALAEFVSDTSIPVEQRTAALGVDLSEARPETPLMTKLMRELGTEDDAADGLEPTDRDEEMRSLLLESPERIADFRMARHAILEQKHLEEHTNVEKVREFAEILLPFANQEKTRRALSEVGSGVKSMGAFFSAGHARQALYETFQNMSLPERTENVQKFADIIRGANTTLFMTNQLSEKMMLDQLLYSGSYSTFEKWFDDFDGWLDMSLLGKPASWVIKGLRKLGAQPEVPPRGPRPFRGGGGQQDTRFWYEGKSGREGKVPSQEVATMEREVKMDAVRSDVKEISPIRAASEMNEERSKLMFKAVVEDETGEAAKALGGASRTEVIADAVLPEMAKASGVRYKPENIESMTEAAKAARSEILEAVEESAVGVLTPRELKIANAHAVKRMKEAIGVTSRTKMFQHEATDKGTRITGVYGPEKGAWPNPETALDLTAIALREHGISREDLYILERNRETGLYQWTDKPTTNDYLVGVTFEYEVNFSKLEDWEKLSTKRNFLDRSPMLAKGKWNRNIVDIASMLHPHLFLNAAARTDKGAKITKDFLVLGDQFAKSYAKQSPEDQNKMYRYLTEANDKGLDFDITSLRGEWQFSDEIIDTLRAFRNYWDIEWQVRNIQDVKALRNRGFGIYEDAKKQDRLFAKPIERTQVARNEKIYDPDLGEAKLFTKAEMDDFYAKGAKIGRLRKPYTVDGVQVSQMVLRNNDKWRGLRNDDIVHPYRKGFFHREYTAPIFIDKRIVTDDGRVVWEAIAHAGNTKHADTYIKRMLEEDHSLTEADFKRRANVKDEMAINDFEMDTYLGDGLGRQKVRGEKLVDATAYITGADSTHILGPVDAIIQSARSVGNRVAMGDLLEAMKQRLVATYPKVLRQEKGQPAYPRSIDDIGVDGTSATKDAADARTLYEYISFLEFGYVNTIDNFTKTLLKSVADVLGESSLKGTGVLEEFAHKAAELSPTGLAKNVAFQAYIVTAPWRQFALNAHQSTLLTMNFPEYVLSQRLAADLHAMFYMRFGWEMPKLAIKATRRSKEELELMFAQFQKTGMAAAIDQSNLMRGALMEMAEANKYKDQMGRTGKALEFLRKVGFNAGEEVNLTSSWLAHYDRISKEKKALTATDYLEIAGRARNFTLNMNKAGDMPYNHNSMSMFFMYMQYPHKSALMLTNRALSRKERGALAFSAALTSPFTPVAMASMLAPILPDKDEHPEIHQAMLTGMQFYMYNKFLELIFQETSRVDFSGMAAYSPAGLFKLMHHLWTTEAGEWVSKSAVGQLFVGNDPRITNAIKAIAAWVNPGDPLDEDPVYFAEMMHEIASISSGYSSAYRAVQGLIYKKAYGGRDQVLDPKVTTPESMMRFFGNPSQDATAMMEVNMLSYQKSKDFRKDIKKWLNDITHRIKQVDPSDAERVAYYQKVMGYGLKAFGNHPIVHQEISNFLERDAKNGVESMYQYISKSVGYMDRDELGLLIDSVPDDDRERNRRFKESTLFIHDEIERQKAENRSLY